MRVILMALMLLGAPAHAGSLVAIIYDPSTKEVMQITVPDADSELDDAAYGRAVDDPKRAVSAPVQMRIPLATFLASNPDQLQAMVPGWVPAPVVTPKPRAVQQ